MAFASTSSGLRQGVKRACLRVQLQHAAIGSSSRAASGAAPAPIDPPVHAQSVPPSPPPPSAPTSASTSTSTSSAKYLDFPPLTPLPRPHSIHTATVRLASYHPAPLSLFTTFALHSAASLGIPTSGAASLPTVTSLYTVPKSPFVHKKSQENFQRKEHKRAIKVFDASRESIDLWLRYLKQHAVGGVGVRAEVYEWMERGQVGEEVRRLEGELRGEGGEKGKRQGKGEKQASLGDKVKGAVSEVKEKAEELVKELSKKAE